MSHKRAQYDDTWSTNPAFSDWIEKKTLYQAYCKVCMKNIELSNMGKRAITSHANGAGHQKKLLAKVITKPLNFPPGPSTSAVPPAS